MNIKKGRNILNNIESMNFNVFAINVVRQSHLAF